MTTETTAEKKSSNENQFYTYEDILAFAQKANQSAEMLIGMESKLENVMQEMHAALESHRNDLQNAEKAAQELQKDPGQQHRNTDTLGQFHLVCGKPMEELLRDPAKAKTAANISTTALEDVRFRIAAQQWRTDQFHEYVTAIEGSDKFKKWDKRMAKHFSPVTEENYREMLEGGRIKGTLISKDLSTILAQIKKIGGLFVTEDHYSDARESYAHYVHTKETALAEEDALLRKEKADGKQIERFRTEFLKKTEEYIQSKREIIRSMEAMIETQPTVHENTLNTMVDDLYQKMYDDIPAEDLRGQLQTINNRHLDWQRTTLKDTSHDKYTFSEHVGKLQKSDNCSVYIGKFYQKLLEHYGFLFEESLGGLLKYHFPHIINIDTTDFHFVVDASTTCDSRDKQVINSMMQNFVVDTIANFPPGKTKFLFCDPENTGVFSMFRDIGKITDNASSACEYAGSEREISTKLDAMCTEISNIVNKTIMGTKTTLFSHNRNNVFGTLPYRFVMMMDFPRRMNNSSLQSLRTIMKNGPRCGIFPVIVNVSGDALELLNENEQKIAREIASNSDFIFRNKVIFDANGNVFGDFKHELDVDEFAEYTAVYNEGARKNEQIRVDIHALEAEPCTDGSFRIPIGRNIGGQIERMSFFGHCQNYLLSGAVGTGKSNALHVIIYNALKYVEHLDLYLVDFKHGVEFAPYAKLRHNAFKVLSVESAPEFGYEVLCHIKNKIEQIGALFKSENVGNYSEYYRKTGKIIPVTLVVMDEFQRLFDGEHAEECASHIEFIAREGRVFNVHLLLATQTIQNTKGLTDGAKDQIFGRIAFFNSETEYKSMLWNNDSLARTISSDYRGQAVVATDVNQQNLVQFAKMNPVERTIEELGAPENGEQPDTKFMISSVEDNPFCLFNKYLNDNADLTQDLELIIGDDISLRPSDIRERMEDDDYRPLLPNTASDRILLKHRVNDNVLIAGNDPKRAETIFMFTLLSALMKQIAEKKEQSITLLTSANTAYDLQSLAGQFPKYIRVFSTIDVLEGAVNDKTEYLFVYGLQNFSSLRFKTAEQQTAAPAAVPNAFTIGSAPAAVKAQGTADGDMFRSALLSNAVNVVVWHNDVQNLANMFGNTATFAVFADLFLHKLGFRMNKEDSVLLIGSESCTSLSERTAVYKCVNDERILRTYDAFGTKFLKTLIQKLIENNKS